MFQSGYAAAMATKQFGPMHSKSGVARWGWPAVSGTLAAVAAGLAIMLWATPVETGESQLASKIPIASKSTVDTPLVAGADPAESKEVPDASDTVALATTNPIEAAISPYLKNVFRVSSSEGSVFKMRNRRLTEALRDEPEQPRIRVVRSRPHTKPLRAMSFKNQQLWGQL